MRFTSELASHSLQFRAWDFSRPLLVAPAMNTFMWESPFTSSHLDALQRLGVKVIPPVLLSPSAFKLQSAGGSTIKAFCVVLNASVLGAMQQQALPADPAGPIHARDLSSLRGQG